MNILFPGRHHMLTKFQLNYLRDIIKNGVNGNKVDYVVFAVTSANHENTRRNPIPLYLRTLAIDKFSEGLPCKVKIYPISDVRNTPKFAQYMIRQISYQWGQDLKPENTLVACSTPSVIRLFEELGFQNLPIELVDPVKDTYGAPRPWEIVELLVKEGNDWRSRNASWRQYAAQASQDTYDEYGLGDIIVELFRDSLLNEDADITDTRDYLTYASGMDNVIDIKFADIQPFVKEGKIVDVGCSTGSLIKS